MFSFLHKKIVSLWNIIKPKKRLGVFGVVFLFTVLVTGWILITKQVSADITAGISELSLALSSLTLWIAGLLLKLTIFVLKFIIEIGGYNGYLDSQAVVVGWVMVRDVVNMGFVIILLVIAFGTILGLEQYEWKKMIVKFIMAAILVNFSRTICGLIIDAAQVVMTTFVNGVAATAGGNLIGAFHADKIMSLSNDATATGLNPQAVFMAATAALVFTVMMLVTMVIYLVILLFRMISLWVLIVLSPIAFVTSVIPQTQKYASEWWKEFINNVISGPLLIFFLWLAFVTIGSGQVHNQISDPKYNSLPASALIRGENSAALQDINGVGRTESSAVGNTGEGGTGTDAPSAGITSVMTWDSMANFFIALAMLLVGAKKAQELGVMGGSMLGKVSDIGKKAFMMASGVGTGLWAAKMAGKGVKAAAYYMPAVGGKALTIRAKNEWASVKNAWYGKAAGLTKEGIETTSQAGAKRAEAEEKRAAAETASGPEKDKLLKEADAAEAESDRLQELAKTQIGGGGVIGAIARFNIGQEKQLKKSEGQLEIRQKLAFKRVAGDSGGIFFNKGKDQIRDSYRYEKGMLEAEEARSAGKDKELSAKGKAGTLAMQRYRDGGFLYGSYQENGQPVWLHSEEEVEKAKAEGRDVRPVKTMIEQIAAHERKAATTESNMKAIRAGVEMKIDLDAKKLVDKARAEEDFINRGLMTPLQKTLIDAVGAAKTARDLEAEKIEKESQPDIDVQKAILDANKDEDGFMAKEAREGANKKIKELEDSREKKISGSETGNKLEKAQNDLNKYLNSDELKAHQSTDEYKSQKAEVEFRKGEIMDGLRGQLGIGGFLASQRAEMMEKQAEASKFQMQGSALGLSGPQSILALMNAAEEGKKAAESFISELKSQDMARQFKDAAKEMTDVLKDKTPGALAKAMENARSGKMGSFVQSLANAQIAKTQEETTGLARRHAEDNAKNAFVYKPRYGTSSPSTAYSEYAKSQMDEFRRLDRAAAMRKATDIMAHLSAKKERGEELEVDQQATLAASTSFLTEEAWVDDKGDYVNDRLKALRNGDLKGEEKKKWESMAKMFHKVGWVKDKKDKDGKIIASAFNDDGTLSKGAVIDDKYERKHAAGLQNLALTGLDGDLQKAHQLISEQLDAKIAEKERVAEETRVAAINSLSVAGATADDGTTLVSDLVKKEQTTALRAAAARAAGKRAGKDAKAKGADKEATAAAVKTAMDQASTDEGVTSFEADTSNIALVQQLKEQAAQKAIQKAGATKIAKAVEDATKDMVTDYFTIAGAALKDAGIEGITTAEQLKARYEKHADILQFATRTFKKNALDTGHEELGYNQDFDETADLYRFQTEKEGRMKMRAERVKMKPRQLINTDQFHTNGVLDNETGVLDDFIEESISVSLGRATKMIEISEMPERSLKGHFYIQKNEDAEQTFLEDGAYAVVGSESARKKFIADGDISEVQQLNHIMARGMITELMSGWKGMALAASKLYGHTNEQEAQRGIVKLQITDLEEGKFKTAQDMAQFVIDKLEANNGKGDTEFMEAFNASNHKNEKDRVLKQMHQIVRESTKSDFQTTQSTTDDDDQAQRDN